MTEAEIQNNRGCPKQQQKQMPGKLVRLIVVVNQWNLTVNEICICCTVGYHRRPAIKVEY